MWCERRSPDHRTESCAAIKQTQKCVRLLCSGIGEDHYSSIDIEPIGHVYSSHSVLFALR